jgi:ribosomal-protein-alanine N-acetyltransferase
MEQSEFLTPWSEESFRHAIETPNGLNLICQRGDEVIGYLTGLVALDEAWITNLLIAREHRRCGFSRRLLACFMDRARERGALHVFLEVRQNNEAAHQLYNKLDFQKIGVRIQYYSDTREDAWVMRKTL